MNKFLWLLRREVWESRAIWVAPAICAAIFVGGVLLAAFGTGAVNIDGTDVANIASQLTPEKASALASLLLGATASPFFICLLFTQFFYTIDALYSERRDRSILFWKSLPLSDTATVLSKLAVALIVMPLAATAAMLLTQVTVFIIASAKFSTASALTAYLWSPAAWGGFLVVTVYVLVASALWYLPVMAWVLLVSAWAPRSPFMYAALPPLALGLAEYIVFRGHYVLAIVGERVGNLGFLAHAMGKPQRTGGFGIVIDKSSLMMPHSIIDLMAPAHFFSSPDVWVGALVGVGLTAAAIWMRRYRDDSI